jgi:hypothetical protein
VAQEQVRLFAGFLTVRGTGEGWIFCGFLTVRGTGQVSYFAGYLAVRGTGAGLVVWRIHASAVRRCRLDCLADF